MTRNPKNASTGAQGSRSRQTSTASRSQSRSNPNARNERSSQNDRGNGDRLESDIAPRRGNSGQQRTGNGNAGRGSSRDRDESSRGQGSDLRDGNRPSESGFHNEHYRAGFDAGRAYHQHYGSDKATKASSGRDDNLNGPREDYAEGENERSAGDYGETVSRSDNESAGDNNQGGDGNSGRSRQNRDDERETASVGGRSNRESGQRSSRGNKVSSRKS